MKRKLELIYEMMEELSPSQKKAILEITYIDHIVELAFDFVKTLKGDKSEQIVYSEENKDKWNEAKEWLEKETINLSSELSKKDLHRHRDENPGF